jgi:hypothetical protein
VTVVPLLVVVIVLAAFEVLAWRYGADSRDGNDWVPPKPARESPRLG